VTRWIFIAVVAIPLVVAAIERCLMLRFLATVYERGGPTDLKTAAAATRHLTPRPGGGGRRAITTASGPDHPDDPGGLDGVPDAEGVAAS